MRDPVAYQRHAAPESTALIDAKTDEEWSYAEFDRAVERTAGRLWSLGVRPGDQLGVLSNTSTEFVRLVHAAWRIGAIFVPLNTRLSKAELGDRIDRVDLSALVFGKAYAERADTDTRGVPNRSFSGLRKESVAEFVAEDSPADSPRAMLFTSGTTGEPKAVVLTGRNLLSSAVASAFRLGVLPDDRWYDPLPGYHMGGLAPIVRSAIYGTCVVLPGEFDAERAIEELATYDATGVSLVPTMLDRMLDSGKLPDSLRFVLTGGAPTPPELIDRCECRGVPIHPSYGMTETASQIATARPTEAFADPERVGRPLAVTRVRAVAADGSPLPPGEPGELVVSGPTVMAGYYGDSEATERAFGPHGYHTGDLGVVEPDGSIRVIGRADETIITGGENVHPTEVTTVLDDHPAIENAAVVGIPDPEWGERVAALVVGEVGETALREFFEGRLAGYKRPKTIEFADALPRTASGTIDREAVRERLSECAG